jgi:hypothetical protein
MAMVMMMTMPEMTMAKPVMPVMAMASAMPTVTATSRDGLAGDGQRSGGQRQGSDRGGHDLLDLRHGSLLGWAELVALR